MRTSSRMAAGLLTAACWTLVAHAQPDAASAAVPSSSTAIAQESAQAPAPASAGVPPAQRTAADRKLKRRVSTALARTKNLNATRILVRVRDGGVTLAGSVTDTAQVNLAAAVARRVDGVTSVSNQLRIDGQQP
ncbi:BON domain-containing protein [Burkholderia cenocepacia]|uniref:Phospholipid-binding exported protein n=1 Tax=Burkholderia cenocepacia (strain ATCC BAA-245 / DSM 16553 / LMG 16656 / NCTC 13227 / J2315 / CF5610) TaxID=216591 RepID=B4ELL4_BURCJ|nr:BON domain-containing protein [Burkholderia cenocepacia]KIS53071.1 BON domain protein [Burkholderia cepacia]QNN06454.1 putative phospholipid-binding exported protein [Burkholderia cenocepacia]UXZ90921.1 BON domain-containing protein [Burkholderia cenocepacia]CAR54523.1 putative phospholipid-binding exported protein [Burkholderia cenocepacia J2315]SPU82351.1 transport-associated [Burkholderia cenocepacia]